MLPNSCDLSIEQENKHWEQLVCFDAGGDWSVQIKAGNNPDAAATDESNRRKTLKCPRTFLSLSTLGLKSE
jgi:hypothetical protein